MNTRLTYALVAGLVLPLMFAGAPSAQEAGSVRLNRTIEILERGQPAFGIISSDRSLSNARALARSNLDFIIIDMEHGPFDTESLQMFLLGMTDRRAILEKGNLQMDVTPFVRIPANGREGLQFLAKQVLDVGAFGVMYPTISTTGEAENAVRATRYPQPKAASDFDPPGLRGRSPGNAVWFWGIQDYVHRADVWPLDPQGELLAIVQIETAEGVANIEEILSVPGIGTIFIGPNDLSTSLGYSDNPGAPEVEEAIQTVLKACLARNIPTAITTSSRTVEQRLQEGFRFVTVGGDGGITAGTAAALQRGRAVAGR